MLVLRKMLFLIDNPFGVLRSTIIEIIQFSKNQEKFKKLLGSEEFF